MSTPHLCDGCGVRFVTGDLVMSCYTRIYAEYTTEWQLCIECTYEVQKTLRRIRRRKERVTNG